MQHTSCSHWVVHYTQVAYWDTLVCFWNLNLKSWVWIGRLVCRDILLGLLPACIYLAERPFLWSCLISCLSLLFWTWLHRLPLRGILHFRLLLTWTRSHARLLHPYRAWVFSLKYCKHNCCNIPSETTGTSDVTHCVANAWSEKPTTSLGYLISWEFTTCNLIMLSIALWSHCILYQILVWLHSCILNYLLCQIVNGLHWYGLNWMQWRLVI